jgi:hypothetical protein
VQTGREETLSLFVGSGTGGFHVYWRLDEFLAPAQFEPIAEALARAALSHGLKIDAQCTVDICRVLRVPGTRSFKEGGGANAKPVTIIYGDGR